jgi:NADP-dependent 3-hydroxy acid dehydrogenase YdfG
VTVDKKRFQGQLALITGASSGIGKAVAVALADHGARLGLVGRDAQRLDEVARVVASAGSQAAVYRADLTDDRDVQSLTTAVRRDYKCVEILVHSAGVIRLGDFGSADVADLDWQYRTNVRAPYQLTQSLLSMLVPFRSQIVFVNSSAGLQARAGVSQYAATKHALKAIADSLREEVHASGIRVLSVFPGRVATPMQEQAMSMLGREYQPDRLLQPEDVAAVVVHALGLPQSAEVRDISIRPLME